MAFTYVTITETFETAGDTPARGTVEFTPIAPMHNGIAVVAATEVAVLDTAGSIAKRLAATTDPTTSPVGVTYRVDERIVGQPRLTYYKAIPHDQGSTLQLSLLPPVAGGGPAGFALRNALDYDDSVAPSDGQVMTWDGTTSKFHPEAVAGGSGAVSSVNGQTGAVTLTASGLGAQPVDADLTVIAALAPTDGSVLLREAGAWAAHSAAQIKIDLALDQVSNTSDAAKPLSTAATAALAVKAPLVSPAFTGTPTAPRFVTTPVTLTASSGVITPDASASSVFRHTTTTNVTLASPTGGVDGQSIEVQVTASGGAGQVLILPDTSTLTIPVGQTWWGHLSYRASDDTWLLDDSGGSSGGAVTAGSPTFTGTVRAARFITDPLTVTYGDSISLDASQSSLFRVAAAGSFSLASSAITGGVDGQTVTLQILAASADRTFTYTYDYGSPSVAIPNGRWWVGRFDFISPANLWIPASSSSGISSVSGGGFGTGPFGTNPFGS